MVRSAESENEIAALDGDLIHAFFCSTRPRTAQIQTASRSGGPEKISNFGTLSEPSLFGAARWQILCEEAANEQDGARLVELIREINDLLAAKQARLSANEKPVTTEARFSTIRPPRLSLSAECPAVRSD